MITPPRLPLDPNLREIEVKVERIDLGPCGRLPQSPAPEYRPNELLIRLHDEAVSRDGYRTSVLPIFEWLKNANASIESLRSASIVEKSISTGVAAWKVNGQNAQVQAVIPSAHWIPNFSDGEWVGPAQNSGIHSEEGLYLYALEIGKLVGNRGFFSLFWAGDNMVGWQLLGPGRLEGDLTGPEDSFRSATGAPRRLRGTFEANSILVAVVANTKFEGQNPSGLIVAGTAGSIPEPYTHLDTTPFASPLSRVPSHKPLVVVPQGAGIQPRVELKGDSSRVFKPLLNEMVQEELRYLRVFFNNAEAAEQLIRCLRTIRGVKYVERFPLVKLTSTAKEIVRLAGSTPTTDPLKVVAPDYLSAVGLVKPSAPFTKINLAILDGLFGPINDPYPTHGTKVYGVALECLHQQQQMEGWTITELTPKGKDTGFVQKEEYVNDPSAYFSALRNIRMRNHAGFSFIQVVNISRGGFASKMEAEEMTKMENADILVVAAAGQNNYGRIADFPAAFPTVLSVGGAEKGKNQEWFPWPDANTKFNPDELVFSGGKFSAVDVVGPAVEIETQYWSLKGTSYAAPMVAALCATVRASKGVTAAVARDIVCKACGTLTGDQEEFGHGMISWKALV